MGVRRGRWVEPVCIVAMFAFCSLVGGAWGLAVRTVPRDIRSIAVMPGAVDVATPTLAPVGLASPTVVVINSTEEGLINYVFRTSDSQEQVIAYYKSLLLKRYGYQNWWVEQRGDGAQVLHFIRAIGFRLNGPVGGQDREHIMVIVSPGQNEQVLVEVRREVTPFQ
jgi:hypothetical protein